MCPQTVHEWMNDIIGSGNTIAGAAASVPNYPPPPLPPGTVAVPLPMSAPPPLPMPLQAPRMSVPPPMSAPPPLPVPMPPVPAAAPSFPGYFPFTFPVAVGAPIPGAAPSTLTPPSSLAQPQALPPPPPPVITLPPEKPPAPAEVATERAAPSPGPSTSTTCSVDEESRAKLSQEIDKIFRLCEPILDAQKRPQDSSRATDSPLGALPQPVPSTSTRLPKPLPSECSSTRRQGPPITGLFHA